MRKKIKGRSWKRGRRRKKRTITWDGGIKGPADECREQEMQNTLNEKFFNNILFKRSGFFFVITDIVSPLNHVTCPLWLNHPVRKWFNVHRYNKCIRSNGKQNIPEEEMESSGGTRILGESTGMDRRGGGWIGWGGRKGGIWKRGKSWGWGSWITPSQVNKYHVSSIFSTFSGCNFEK